MSHCTFVTNVYEKTYRALLAPGQLANIIQPHAFTFAERLVTINNVKDRAHASQMAEAAVARGEIDRYVFVDDELDIALKKAHLTRKKLGRIPYYSNCALVALSVTRTTYLMYQDAEVILTPPGGDWITQGIQMLEQIPAAFVVEPIHEHTVEVFKNDAFLYYKDYIISYGFSDLMFLVRSAILQEPFHQKLHWASLRYPIAGIEPIFEQWMDSYMRIHHKLRFTDRRFMLRHDGPGESHFTPHTLLERVRRKINVFLYPIGMKRSAIEGKRIAKSLLPEPQLNLAAFEQKTEGNL